jgi:hypothetical protein
MALAFAIGFLAARVLAEARIVSRRLEHLAALGASNRFVLDASLRLLHLDLAARRRAAAGTCSSTSPQSSALD